MDDFPSNSHSSDEPSPPKKITKIVEGTVTRRKKPLGKRLLDNFGGDINGVGTFVLVDVLIPAFKEMVVDAGQQGIEKMFFGEVRSTRRSRSGRHERNYVHYERMTRSSDSKKRDPRDSRRTSRSMDFDDIILASRVMAEEVLDRMFELIKKYESVTVADLYDLVGIDNNVYTANNWGWTDLRGSGVTKIKGGYLLDLPQPEPLD